MCCPVATQNHKIWSTVLLVKSTLLYFWAGVGLSTYFKSYCLLCHCTGLYNPHDYFSTTLHVLSVLLEFLSSFWHVFELLRREGSIKSLQISVHNFFLLCHCICHSLSPFVTIRHHSSPFVATFVTAFVTVCHHLSPFVTVCYRWSQSYNVLQNILCSSSSILSDDTVLIESRAHCYMLKARRFTLWAGCVVAS